MFAQLTPSLAQSVFRLQRCSMQIVWLNGNWANSSSRWWTDVRNRTAEADASLLQETCIFLLNNFSTFMKKHMTKFWSCGRWGQISKFYIETTEFLTALWISLPKFASVVFFFHWRMWPVVVRNHLHAVQMCRVQFHIFCPNNWIWHL